MRACATLFSSLGWKKNSDVWRNVKNSFVFGLMRPPRWQNTLIEGCWIAALRGKVPEHLAGCGLKKCASFRSRKDGVEWQKTTFFNTIERVDFSWVRATIEWNRGRNTDLPNSWLLNLRNQRGSLKKKKKTMLNPARKQRCFQNMEKKVVMSPVWLRKKTTLLASSLNAIYPFRNTRIIIDPARAKISSISDASGAIEKRTREWRCFNYSVR